MVSTRFSSQVDGRKLSSPEPETKRLLVMGPETDNFNDALFLEDLVDEAMLDVYPP